MAVRIGEKDGDGDCGVESGVAQKNVVARIWQKKRCGTRKAPKDSVVVA